MWHNNRPDTKVQPGAKLKLKSIFSILIASILVASTVSADPTHGAQSAYGVIAPGEVDVFTTRCNADEVTVFAVLGDGDGDTDCYLYDDNGN
jgi:hypothetical protein